MSPVRHRTRRRAERRWRAGRKHASPDEELLEVGVLVMRSRRRTADVVEDVGQSLRAKSPALWPNIPDRSRRPAHRRALDLARRRLRSTRQTGGRCHRRHPVHRRDSRVALPAVHRASPATPLTAIPHTGFVRHGVREAPSRQSSLNLKTSAWSRRARETSMCSQG